MEKWASRRPPKSVCSLFGGKLVRRSPCSGYRQTRELFTRWASGTALEPPCGGRPRVPGRRPCPFPVQSPLAAQPDHSGTMELAREIAVLPVTFLMAPPNIGGKQASASRRAEAYGKRQSKTCDLSARALGRRGVFCSRCF